VGRITLSFAGIDDVQEAVLEITGGDGVDVVYDGVGGPRPRGTGVGNEKIWSRHRLLAISEQWRTQRHCLSVRASYGA